MTRLNAVVDFYEIASDEVGCIILGGKPDDITVILATVAI